MTTGDSEQLIRVVITRDHSRAQLVLDAAAPSAMTSHEACIDALTSAGVVISQDVHDAVDVLLESHEPGRQSYAMVAHAVPARKGDDGIVHWLDADEIGDTPDARESDEDDPVSFYEQRSLTMVAPGDVLGHVEQPKAGTPGTTVLGAVIPARAGTPARPQIDDSIRLEEDGRLVAAVEGVFSRKGLRASVRRYLQIAGDVDFSTGNIDFSGEISVCRGIRDRFQVAAEHDLEVLGLIEAAQVRSGGNLAALGGVAGRGHASIRAGADLVLRYADAATIECGGTLRVAREIINCTTLVHGNVDAPNGRLIGGTLRCRGTVLLAAVGSPASVQTEVVLGAAPEIDARLQRLDDIRRAATSRRAELTTLLQVAGAGAAEAMQTEIDALGHRLERCDACRERLFRQRSRLLLKTRLSAQNMIHAGTRITFGDDGYRIRKDLRGPIWVDRDTNGIALFGIGKGRPSRLSTIADAYPVAA
ncbi:MAG: FapA family protein [Planctomycetota bacterium]